MSKLPRRLSHECEELRRLCHSGQPLDRLQQQVAERVLSALDGQAWP